ncbi:MAG: helix-turn-helix transcriptional regulator [Treponema sp.]|nr:helix-turn-helix transcriptional regulator [Treponema sp.]
MTNEEVLQYVVNSIRIIRKQKKISQMELCLRANMSQGFLTNIETGKKEPSAMTLIRIADALEVSPREFFPESETGEGIDVKSEIKNEILELLARL